MMLTRLLQRHRHEIVAAWTTGLRNLRSRRYAEWSPGEVAAWPLGALDAIIRSGETGSDALLKAHATAIAEQRAAQGFEIDEVIEGLLLLNEAALPFIVEAYPDAPAEAMQATLELDRGLRLMAAQFAALFARSMRQTVQQVAALEERQRLARDLHDLVSQSLYGLSMSAEAAARLLEGGHPREAAARLRDVRDSAGEALREMRFLIFDLRPSILQEEGLAAALAARLTAVEQRVGVRAELQAEGVGRLPAAVEEALYGIAREALNNSLKHAHATRVEMRLRRSADTATLDISDNGVGFDADRGDAGGGLGLRGMRERADRIGASCAILARPGHGTLVRVSAPLDAACCGAEPMGQAGTPS
jgi:signal transduction histidine kinase